MSRYPQQPAVGECSQFLSNDGLVTACRVVGYDGRTRLVIDYRSPKTGEVIRGALISVFDLVSDEDAALHDFAP